MRILVADDEPLALAEVRRMLEREPDVEVVGVARSGDEALRLVSAMRPDLLVLDIHMPGLNGVDVAQRCVAGRSPEVVFLTAHPVHAVEAFALDAVDYLLKPLDPERLRQALARARRRRTVDTPRAGDGPMTTRASDAIFVAGRGGGLWLDQSLIVWVEAARDYALLHTEERGHMLRITMGELSRRLRPGIVRVHRSAFVALDRVARFVGGLRGAVALELSDGSVVDVGPTYMASVRHALPGLDHP